jgi:hypothetical protein
LVRENANDLPKRLPLPWMRKEASRAVTGCLLQPHQLKVNFWIIVCCVTRFSGKSYENFNAV